MFKYAKIILECSWPSTFLLDSAPCFVSDAAVGAGGSFTRRKHTRKQYELPLEKNVWRMLRRTRFLDNRAFCHDGGAYYRLCDLYSVHR